MYNKALSLLENGKYQEANEILLDINTYDDVPEILEQVKYESYAYACINKLKECLKNPDSYSPYEITFYTPLADDVEYSEYTSGYIGEENGKFPICIMHYGAQNGFGGNTTGYAFFSYSDEENSYRLVGTCESLDENEYDVTDTDELADAIVCTVINMYKEKSISIGSIDMQRLKTLLKNDAYSTIKIIE